MNKRLRVAAIDFLNPAPLMWDFDHAPRKGELAARYEVHRTSPARCAEELLLGRADLGLIPIASLDDSLAIVPGCTIASLSQVRSIQLIVKIGKNKDSDESLASIGTVAADTASRSSVIYAQILFRRFLGTDPEFLTHEAKAIAMLAHADAALLIGDAALLALEHREAIEQTVGPCLWLDLAEQWISRTQLPWVAAVWAVRPEALAVSSVSRDTLVDDLERSRNMGLHNIERLVEEWSSLIEVPPSTIRTYLTHNISYILSPACVESIRLFRAYAAEAGLLSPTELRFL